MTSNDSEGSRGELVRLLAEQGEEPAFVRRHRRLVESTRGFYSELRSRRWQNLRIVEDLLKILGEKITQKWERLSPLLVVESEFTQLRDLWAELQIDQIERPNPYADQWLWSIRRALPKLDAAIESFNLHWDQEIKEIDLRAINQIISQYNEYYPLEKSCAFGIEDIERLGFTPAIPIDREQFGLAMSDDPASEIAPIFPRLLTKRLDSCRNFRKNFFSRIVLAIKSDSGRIFSSSRSHSTSFGPTTAIL